MHDIANGREHGGGKPKKRSLAASLLLTVPILAAIVIAMGVVASHLMFPSNDHGYMGSEQCNKCHAEQYQSWKQTPHARDTQAVEDGARVYADLSSNFVCSGMNVDYTLGTRHEQMYLTFLDEEKKGDLHVLPCKWDFGKEEIETVLETIDGWKENSYQENCMGCHSLDYRPENKSHLELGVSCEKCHGPGSWHRKIFSERRMFSFEKATVEEEVMVCGQCHLQGGFAKGSDKIKHPVSFRPGQNLHEQYDYDFNIVKEDARAVLAGEKDVDIHQKYVIWKVHEGDPSWSCTSCHDVHLDKMERHEQYSEKEEICLICHVSADQKTEEEWPRRPYSEDCNVCGFSTAD